MSKPRKRRGKLSLTSLIDVIFLLLLFFMLTSTFSKFSEIELSAASSGNGALLDIPPMFLRLSPTSVSLNGSNLALNGILASSLKDAKKGTPVLISLKDGVNAQRLADLLVVLRGLPNLAVTVLGS